MHIAGFEFTDEAMGLQAQKEMKAIKYINAQMDKENPEEVLQIYNSAIEKEMFKSALGIEYLSELRDFLSSMDEIKKEDVRDIPIREAVVTKTVEVTKEVPVEKIVEKKVENEKPSKSNDKAVKKFKISLMLNIVLAAVIVAMLIIASTSDNPTILNYEEKVVDKYSSWDEELTEREKNVTERENEVTKRENNLYTTSPSISAEDSSEEADDTDNSGEAE